MKANIFLSLAVLMGASLTAQAAPLDIQAMARRLAAPQANIMSGSPSPKPIAPLTPIRTAIFKYRLTKTIYEKVGTGFNVRTEEVCQLTGAADVYDTRGLTDYSYSNTKVGTCKSTLDGKPVDVEVYGFVVLTNGPLFLSEPDSDIKVFVASVYSGSLEQSPFGAVASRDLGLKSVLLQVQPTLGYSCSGEAGPPEEGIKPTMKQVECRAYYPEAFSALIEIMD